MIVVDLRGQDRASGAIPGTAHIPAMDLLKETGSYVEKFRHQPIVALFCQYSAHRAPTVAGCICSIFLQYTVSVFGLDWFTMVYHPSKAFKSDIFRRGKAKQQGRQLLQKELPVQAARRGA